MIESTVKRVSRFRPLWWTVSLMILALSLPFAGCSKVSAPASAGDEVGGEPPDWREDRLALGEETYEQVCASCHESGQDGAPRTGVQEDWEDRSKMWQAVLFNHAKAGYLDMPGKGGKPELSDEAVEAAAEYMLGLTFPELPRD